MKCTWPPPLTEDQISALLDDDADPSVKEHVKECLSCASRFDEAKRLEDKFHRVFFRWDCPSPQQLGDYHFQLLDSEEMDTISRHLRQCSHCKKEVDELRTFLGSNATTETAKSKSSRPNNILITQFQLRSPAFATRGRDEALIVASADGVSVYLETQQKPEGFVLLGQLVTDDQQKWIEALVEVWIGGDLESTGVVDELGGFECQLGQIGEATLRITAPSGLAIVLSHIQLKTK